MKTQPLFFVYYALAFLTPLALAVIFSFIYSGEILSEGWRGLFLFFSILMVMPVTIIYSFIAAEAFFPQHRSSSLITIGQIIFPFLITLFLSKNLAATLAMQGLVFASGFIFVLVTGCLILVYNEWPDTQEKKDIFWRLLALTAIIVPFLSVFIFYFLTGWHYIQIYPAITNPLFNNLLLVAQFINVFFLYWPKMTILYHRGAL